MESPREAMQAAWAHVIFNLLGVLLWLAFIPQFADLVRSISPVSGELQGLEGAAAGIPRQIANAHTVFNVANLVIFIWFTIPLARLVERLVPAPAAPPGIQPEYLDEFFIDQPAMALDQVRRELQHLGSLVKSMIDRSVDTALTGFERDADALSRADDDVDKLYEEIIRYLGMLSQATLINPQPQYLQNYVGIANYLENIGDVIKKDLLDVVGKRIRKHLVISESTATAMRALAKEVGEAYDKAMQALETGNPDDALDVQESKQSVADLAEEATSHIAKRLVADEPDRLENFHIESEIIESYKRLNTLTRRIARLAVQVPESDAEAAGDS
jgi:phosphate:Na+ symporter